MLKLKDKVEAKKGRNKNRIIKNKGKQDGMKEGKKERDKRNKYYWH
jgi:hypothetical protein